MKKIKRPNFADQYEAWKPTKEQLGYFLHDVFGVVMDSKMVISEDKDRVAKNRKLAIDHGLIVND